MDIENDYGPAPVYDEQPEYDEDQGDQDAADEYYSNFNTQDAIQKCLYDPVITPQLAPQYNNIPYRAPTPPTVTRKRVNVTVNNNTTKRRKINQPIPTTGWKGSVHQMKNIKKQFETFKSMKDVAVDGDNTVLVRIEGQFDPQYAKANNIPDNITRRYTTTTDIDRIRIAIDKHPLLSFHEVIQFNKPVHFFMDLDDWDHNVGLDDMIKAFNSEFCTFFNELFKLEGTNELEAICIYWTESIGYDEHNKINKTSAHVHLVDYKFDDIQQVGEVAFRFKVYLRKLLANDANHKYYATLNALVADDKVLDLAPYKANKSLRIANSSKLKGIRRTINYVARKSSKNLADHLISITDKKDATMKHLTMSSKNNTMNECGVDPIIDKRVREVCNTYISKSEHSTDATYISRVKRLNLCTFIVNLNEYTYCEFKCGDHKQSSTIFIKVDIANNTCVQMCSSSSCQALREDTELVEKYTTTHIPILTRDLFPTIKSSEIDEQLIHRVAEDVSSYVNDAT